MITFSILLILLAILIALTVLALGTGGVVFFLVFGDVIICILIIVWLLKRIFGKKKKD